MTLGRTKNVSAPRISAPPSITQYQYQTPTGDMYSVARNGNTEMNQSILSPQTEATVATSQEALGNLASDLNQTDPQLVQDIAQKSQNFYDLQAQNINHNADALNSQTQSDLAQRFGGAYNATFGTTLLGQQNKNRLNQLYSASKDATMYGQNLYQQDQQNKIQRFQAFGNYLNDQNRQAQDITQYGSGLLQNEAGRAQNLAISRAQLLQNAQLHNQNTTLQLRQQRLGLIQNLMSAGSSMAGAQSISTAKAGGSLNSSTLEQGAMLA